MPEVYLEENSRYADETARRKIGEFVTFAEALNVCQKIVDDFLAQHYKTEMTAGELYRLYTMFGEDVFIVGDSMNEKFSAWEYAEKRAREITRNKFFEL